MYPLVVIFGVSLLKKSLEVIDYAFPLAFFGLAVSVYHNYIYYQSLASPVCSAGESCTVPYVTEFGYIGIPMMALTAFLLIITLLLIKKYKKD
jgi:disulfide bond formation protein DsbB